MANPANKLVNASSPTTSKVSLCKIQIAVHSVDLTVNYTMVNSYETKLKLRNYARLTMSL